MPVCSLTSHHLVDTSTLSPLGIGKKLPSVLEYSLALRHNEWRAIPSIVR